MTSVNISAQRKKEGRGLFLILLLLFHSLLAIYCLYTFILLGEWGSIIFAFDYGWFEGIFRIMSYVFIVLIILTIPFLWRWSKIGVFGVIILFIISVLFLGKDISELIMLLHNTNIHFKTNATQMLNYFWSLYPLIFFLVYLFAIKRKQHLFT